MFKAPAATSPDKGPEFANSAVTDRCQARGVRRLFLRPYAPVSDGLIERRGRISETLFYRFLGASRSEFARGARRIGDIVAAARGQKCCREEMRD